MEHIYFPTNWKDRFPDFYDSMVKYQREGKNAHDDAQDAKQVLQKNAMQKVILVLIKSKGANLCSFCLG